MYGKKPSAEVGEYFRANVWGWGPLAEYVTDQFPEIASGCEHWFTNDGDGLGKRDSQRLAKALYEALVSGAAQRYVDLRNAGVAAMPDAACDVCGGEGRRAELPETGPGFLTCNGCGGTGVQRPFESWYSLKVEDVERFRAFLEHCGGFEIW
ncbi:MAG: hypothetical protein H0T51_06425 [Pirellulales bacterium]|nr:hypothetical protein [Pirellulales bacterium]